MPEALYDLDRGITCTSINVFCGLILQFIAIEVRIPKSSVEEVITSNGRCTRRQCTTLYLSIRGKGNVLRRRIVLGTGAISRLFFQVIFLNVSIVGAIYARRYVRIIMLQFVNRRRKVIMAILFWCNEGSKVSKGSEPFRNVTFRGNEGEMWKEMRTVINISTKKMRLIRTRQFVVRTIRREDRSLYIPRYLRRVYQRKFRRGRSGVPSI